MTLYRPELFSNILLASSLAFALGTASPHVVVEAATIEHPADKNDSPNLIEKNTNAL